MAAAISASHRKQLAFKHLFRHYDDISMDCWLRCAEPLAFLLSCGYTQEDIESLEQKGCPKLLNYDVHDHLAPHIRFLVRSLEGGTGDLVWEDDATVALTDAEECQYDDNGDTSDRHRLLVSNVGKQAVPASFFNLRLEKALAPWHAYLSWQEGLPSGSSLLEEEGRRLHEFLDVCASSKLANFVDLCNKWDNNTGKQHTAQDISEFQYAFHEGLVPTVRNHLHATVDCEPGYMTELLLQHGANHLEDDHYGASLLHWAAGTGNIRAVVALIQAGKEDGIPVEEIIKMDHASKDGATPLHWAASGVTPHGVFGSGGHPDVCQLLLDLAGTDLTNETTYTHNSPLEWAAWAGSLDVVKLLVEDYGADVHFCSENGNVAHWACAGGSLPVCRYFADIHSVDFCIPNVARGWTPLDLASSEGYADVTEWLVQRFYASNEKDQKRRSQEELFDDVSEEAMRDFMQKQPWNAQF